MILFLEYKALGRRGGELFTEHVHAFLKRKYENIIPAEYSNRPGESRGVTAQLKHGLKLVERHNPEMIVADISSGARNILAARKMKNNGKAVLVIVQDQRMNFRLNLFGIAEYIVRFCENYLIRNADFIIVNSRNIGEAASKRAIKGTPVIIARPGLYLQHENIPQQAKTAPAVEQTIHILNAGEPERRKGTIYLIRAMNLLKGHNIHLHITGEFKQNSSYCKILVGEVAKFGLQDRITFHGYVSAAELDKLYRQSHIFVMPSLSEGYGIAMAEALCYGLPVVASNVAAIPEMIENEINGILVLPKDPQAVADGILKILGSPELYEKMSGENLKKSRSLPSWNDFNRTLETELVPLIGKFTGLTPSSNPVRSS